MAEATFASAEDVRTWARANNVEVGTRGQFSRAVIDAFNKGRRVKYVKPSERS